MFGKPTEVTYAKINTIIEAIKVAETATELGFKTSYKLARLGSHLEEFVKVYKKVKGTVIKTYQTSKQDKSDLDKFTKANTEIEEMTEAILMPDFKMSEFVSGDGDKRKYLVSQAFLNRMVGFIEDDIFKLPETTTAAAPRLASFLAEEAIEETKEEAVEA